MDYIKILEIIEGKKNKEDIKLNNVINDIREYISMGSTGGEISGMVGKYLKDLKYENYEAYSILENDIMKYLLDCKRNGLIIR